MPDEAHWKCHTPHWFLLIMQFFLSQSSCFKWYRHRSTWNTQGEGKMAEADWSHLRSVGQRVHMLAKMLRPSCQKSFSSWIYIQFQFQPKAAKDCCCSNKLCTQSCGTLMKEMKKVFLIKQHQKQDVICNSPGLKWDWSYGRVRLPEQFSAQTLLSKQTTEVLNTMLGAGPSTAVTSLLLLQDV